MRDEGLLVTKLQLGNANLEAPAFFGLEEAGASPERFPSWSLGTREEALH